MKTILAILMVLTLAGCATLSKSECMEANWQQIGAEDGSRGQLESFLGQHQKACAKHGVSVDSDNYLTGRKKGLENYCTIKSAYTEGMRGNEYGGVCSEESATKFQQAYVEGLKIRLDTLYLEYNRLDFKLFAANYRQRHRHPYKRPHKKQQRWRENELFSLRNQHQRLISERLKIQRWIEHWSGS